MDLSTKYLGFTLPHPLMAGASPLATDLDSVKRLEDAGAAAIVMPSLFEEQITRDQLGMVGGMLLDDASAEEALAQFPAPDEYTLPRDRYLEHLRRLKATVGVPVFGSLNGTTPEGWLDYARLIQDAGADALELNFYHVTTDPRESGAYVEHRLIDLVRHVKRAISIPVAVKLSPFFSSLPNLAQELDAARADGLILFNRFYQPDVDPEMLQAVPRLYLSTPHELLLRVRWLAILYGTVEASLAATGGVHSGVDALKAILAGAQAVQVVSALLIHGPGHLAQMRREVSRWLEQNDYDSLRQAQGSLSLLRNSDAQSFERGNYLRILQSWRGVGAAFPFPRSPRRPETNT
jgi:dihydroorotate dehydrogenase (fumarate)